MSNMFERELILTKVELMSFFIHNTVQPYIKADHDSDLTDAEKATLERFINDFMAEDAELKHRVNEILKKHIV